MIFTVNVRGIIRSTLQAFSNTFAVKCDTDRQALDVVETELDWSDACISCSQVAGHLEDSAMPGISHGQPCRM